MEADLDTNDPQDDSPEDLPRIGVSGWQKGLNWFEQYEFVEAELRSNPDLTLTELSGRLGLTEAKILQVIKLMSVLNENSRQMIRDNLSQAGPESAGEE